MKLLITGGAGFIGSHLIDALLREGHDVVCVDDMSLGRKEHIAPFLSDGRFSFFELNVNDADALRAVFAKHHFDCVFHLAANSDIKKGREDTSIDLNRTFLTTFSVLDRMREAGVKRIVFASTSAVYGELQETLHEDIGPLFPISLYGAAKLASEGYITAFGENYGIQAWMFRFPNVVGERTTHGIIHDFIAKLDANPQELIVLGDGTQRKPYLYVKDLIDGILFGWKGSTDRINCFNLGVDDAVTVTRIAEIIIEEMGLTGVAITYTGGDRGWVGDVPFFSYNLSRINALGWRAARSSEEAIRLAVREELAHRGRTIRRGGSCSA